MRVPAECAECDFSDVTVTPRVRPLSGGSLHASRGPEVCTVHVPTQSSIAPESHSFIMQLRRTSDGAAAAARKGAVTMS